MSTKTRTFSEPPTAASEPLRPAPVQFTFRSAPRRYTAALVLLGVLVVFLAVALLLVTVLGRGTEPQVVTLVAAGTASASASGPTYPLGPRTLVCRDAHAFACLATETKCRRPASSARALTGIPTVDVGHPMNASTALAKARMFYEACVRSGNASPADLLRVAGVERTARPVGHERLFNDSRHGEFLLAKIVVNASVPLFFRLGVWPASRREPAVI
ncbi:unnamed protein product, partial [Ixodes hexagonus]